MVELVQQQCVDDSRGQFGRGERGRNNGQGLGRGRIISPSKYSVVSPDERVAESSDSSQPRDQQLDSGPPPPPSDTEVQTASTGPAPAAQQSFAPNVDEKNGEDPTIPLSGEI